MLIDLTDQVVVVTGGGRGIGRVISERFLAEGARVIALDLAFSGDEIEGDPERLVTFECNVADPDQVARVVAEIDERFGRIDALVNNAGINAEGLVSDLTYAEWQRCLDVNAGSVFVMSQAVAPLMKRAGRGRIINAASFAAIVPSVASAAYAASKAAVVQLTRVLASELGPWDITVNAYAPGMIPTAINGFAEMSPEAQDRLLATLSLRRWGRASEVADLICFLSSDFAGYITGALIDVSGGKLATQIPARAYELAE